MRLVTTGFERALNDAPSLTDISTDCTLVRVQEGRTEDTYCMKASSTLATRVRIVAMNKMLLPGDLDATLYLKTVIQPEYIPLQAYDSILVTVRRPVIIAALVNGPNLICAIGITVDEVTFDKKLCVVTAGGYYGHTGSTIAATGRTILSGTDWNVIQAKVTPGTGNASITVRLNDRNEIQYTGFTYSTASHFAIGVVSTANTNEFTIIRHDDVAVNDTSGEYQNGWPGSGRVAWMTPNDISAVYNWSSPTSSNLRTCLLDSSTSTYVIATQPVAYLTFRDWTDVNGSGFDDNVYSINLVQPHAQAKRSRMYLFAQPENLQLCSAYSGGAYGEGIELDIAYPSSLVPLDVMYVNPATQLPWSRKMVNDVIGFGVKED